MDADHSVARRELAKIVDQLTATAAGGGIATPHTANDNTLSIARAERVVPILARAIQSQVAVSSEEVASAIDEAWNISMRRCLLMEERIVWLHGELAALGIEMRVLKGSASAHLDHSGPEMREFGDIDILVRGTDMPRVFELLQQQGFTRAYETPGSDFDQRFIKSASFRGDVEIDVHRTLTDNPLGHRIVIDDLWATSSPFTLGSTTVHALPRELRFVHACLHGHLGRPPMRLSTLSDVLELVRRSDLDHEGVLEVADRWGLRPVVTGAISQAIAEVSWPADIDPRYAEPGAPSLGDALLIAAHRSPRSSSTVRTLLSLITLPDARTRLDFLRSLALASSRYRSEHRRPVRSAASRLGRAFGLGTRE